MPECWAVKALWSFGSAHASLRPHFNVDRHLKSRDTLKPKGWTPWPDGANRRCESRILWKCGESQGWVRRDQCFRYIHRAIWSGPYV